MNIAELLVALLRNAVELENDGNNLSYHAPKGVLTPEWREGLIAHKAELMALLEPGRKYLQCSFAQERLWFLQQFELESPAYNVPLAMRLSGQLNIAALEQSINEIIKRHAALRTTFTAFEGIPAQVIQPASHFRCSLQTTDDQAASPDPAMIDLSALPAAEQEAALSRLIEKAAWQPFDLSCGPLLQITLFRQNPTEHILFLNLHHIITDGWSMHVFFRELASLYETFVAGNPVTLPAPTIQYSHFSQWQRQWLGGDVLESQLAYWTKQLADVPVLQLPTDRPRATRQAHRVAREGLTLPPPLTTALKELSRQEEATLFMTMLTAFKIVLGRYTNQEDVCVGSFVANRNQAETENLIGFFVNNLALRTSLAGRPTVRELLQRVREVTLGAYAYQDLPFEKILEAVHPERALSDTPLFQVMCVLQNFPAMAQQLPGLTLSLLDSGNVISDFDLTLWILEQDSTLRLELEYSAELFEPTTIARMACHLQQVLAGMVANPEQHITAIPLLTPAERRQILTEWNPAQATDAPKPYVQHLFETQAQRTPDALAVVFEKQGLTYRELDQRANHVAHRLRAMGVGPDSLVGVYMERSLEFIVGILGVLKAGGAYVPFDPTYPPERLAFMRQDIQPITMLTHSQHVADVEGYAAPIVCLDAAQWTINDTAWQLEQTPPLTDTLAPENLAYVIYTSGSTGRPKGVLVTHQSLTSYVQAVLPRLQLHDHDRVLQFASFSFDATTEELFPALLSGATVMVRPEMLRAPGAEFARFIEQNQLTVLSLPTAFWHEWVSELAQAKSTLPASLRLVLLNAEEPSAERLAVWQTLSQGRIRWVNTYGPTETTVTATWFEPEFKEASSWAKVPIGRPLANTQLYVLDRYDQLVPSGVSGELYIGGAGVTRGYHQRPDLTATAFLPNPFSTQPGARLYKTGDIVRYRPDGTLEFLGRQDAQVKVRGHRVELGEIEAALGQHPAVRERVVIIREDEPAHQQIVAYLVPEHPPESVDALTTALLDFLKERLPVYMVPAAIVVLEAFPLSPNGKIDRRKLPAPARELPPVTEGFIAPRLPEEEILADIWSRILGVERISTTANFFELGGHSLMATQLVSRVRDVFNIELPLRTVFEAPVLAQLAESIAVARRQAQGLELPPLRPISHEGDLPLSFAQQRMWFLHQLEPDSPAYHIMMAVRFSGPLNTLLLEQCLNEIVRRHETLRTTFTLVEGTPMQRIAPLQTTTNIALTSVDLHTASETDREAQAQRYALAELRRPFDLSHGPLLRVSLLHLSADDHIFLVTMHHIVSDGWSAAVFVRELKALYAAFSLGQPSPLPTLPIQYVDFAAWQRNWLQGTMLATQLAYWKKQLANAPTLLALPTDHQRPTLQTFAGASYFFALSSALTEALHTLSRRAGSTLFMTLLSAFKVLLARYSGQSDIVVGTPIANRMRGEVEGLIGLFVNTLVLRTQLSDDLTFLDLLERVRETALEAYAHQDLPFERLVDELQIERSLSYNPLFQVMFTIQNPLQSDRARSSLTTSSPALDLGAAQVDLEWEVIETDAGLQTRLIYSADLFEPSTIARLAEHFQILLHSIVADPQQPLSRLNLLSEAERERLLMTWNASQAPYPQEKVFSELFEAQVARIPDSIAAACEGEPVTYRYLNSRANQLARQLIAQGITTDSVVALLAERSLDFLTAILGVFKAGGAYLPLDPYHPASRLRQVVVQSKTHLLLVGDDFVATAAEVVAELPEEDRPIVWRLSEVLQQLRADGDLPVRSSPRALAYVIYTSGSTGLPKGAMVEQRGMINHLYAKVRELNLTGADILAQTATQTFDISVWQFLACLAVGGAVDIFKDDIAHDPQRLLKEVESRSITVWETVPSLLRAVLEQASVGVLRFNELRWLIPTGEALPPDLARQWLKYYPHVPLVNAYGPTECSDDVTHHHLTEPPAESVIRVPIGRPATNMRLYVLDRHLQPTPIGIPGELYIGGDGVGRGYLYEPIKTAQTFIPDAFASEPGARLYKTGDLAYWSERGELEFLGRLDFQVKLHGFRIELGEIEAALAQHDQVKENLVMLREDDASDPHLAAYFVPSQLPAPTTNELREFLRERLPEYMIPRAFVALEAFPLTASGKINRRALPAPDPQQVERTNAYVAPTTPFEEILADIWSEVLHLEQISMQDNFFEIGGHSLIATQIVSRVRAQFEIELPLRTIFEAPTIAQMAARVEQLVVADIRSTAS